MKLFQCSNCKDTVVFENHTCVNCSYFLGYPSYFNAIVSLDTNVSQWQLPSLENKTYVYCENHKHDVCNWLVETGQKAEI
ncbi:zinc-ribbon domain-containing protein [uncultured Maribacter sp.]|uniref:zinc-ribbon domain-containing protein n=1 Tax=uncultured Maribacter sp. TaxID=431308 RepID=UPI0030D9CAD8